MPYSSLPDEATARATIENTLMAVSPGVLAPGAYKHVVVGSLDVLFYGYKTRTSWVVSASGHFLVRGTVRSGRSGDVLRIGKVFARGWWETALGVEMVRYCAESSDPLPDEMISEVRDVVDGKGPADDVLGHFQQAMWVRAEFVGCIRDRSDGVADMIEFMCVGFDLRFLIALAVVLRFAGARSFDIELILQIVERQGGNVYGILSEILDTADRIEAFEQLMAISPNEQQRSLIGHSVGKHRHLFGGLGSHLRDEDNVREFYDRLTTAFEREGLALVPVGEPQPMCAQPR